jgi:hypothetical protein
MKVIVICIENILVMCGNNGNINENNENNGQ